MLTEYNTLTYIFNNDMYMILHGSRVMTFDSYQKAKEFNDIFLSVVDIKTMN